MEYRNCTACGTLLKPTEHIGMASHIDENTGLVQLTNNICENCLNKYIRQTLVSKAIHKLVKADKSVARRCMMVYPTGVGKTFEILILNGVPKSVLERFMSRPNNLPFTVD